MNQSRNDQNQQHLSTHIKPVVLNELIQNGQPTFGIFAHVKNINYLDYHSHLISQKTLPNWRKELKANQFCFIQIIQPPYRICLALATIKLATSAFVYLYNDETDELEVCEALQPLTRHTLLEGDCHQGQMAFFHANLTVTLDFMPSQIKVALDSQYIALHATLARQAQPLAICTPTGRRGWTFTQKEPLTAISGHLLIKANSKFNTDAQAKQIHFSKTTIANLDWTLGYMRHKTNACWLDGQIYYLPPVLFIRKDLDTSVQNTWRVYHQNLGWSNVGIDLTFTPMTVYKKTDNFGVLASIFEQWLGFYSGEIRIKNELIKFDKVMGLAEDHFAKW